MDTMENFGMPFRYCVRYTIPPTLDTNPFQVENGDQSLPPTIQIAGRAGNHSIGDLTSGAIPSNDPQSNIPSNDPFIQNPIPLLTISSGGRPDSTTHPTMQANHSAPTPNLEDTVLGKTESLTKSSENALGRELQPSRRVQSSS